MPCLCQTCRSPGDAPARVRAVGLGRRLLDLAAYPLLPGGSAVRDDRESEQRQYGSTIWRACSGWSVSSGAGPKDRLDSQPAAPLLGRVEAR
jgi:hypothetical protein